MRRKPHSNGREVRSDSNSLAAKIETEIEHEAALTTPCYQKSRS